MRYERLQHHGGGHVALTTMLPLWADRIRTFYGAPASASQLWAQYYAVAPSRGGEDMQVERAERMLLYFLYTSKFWNDIIMSVPAALQLDCQKAVADAVAESAEVDRSQVG